MKVNFYHIRIVLIINAIRNKQLQHNQKKDIDLFNRIKSSFYDIKKHLLQKQNIAMNQIPIFIVGMPRSGSTLIEQILASHSAVLGRGELSALGDLIFELEQSGKSYPALLSELDARGLRELGQRYLEAAGTSSGIFVDKMPNNFLLIGSSAIFAIKASPSIPAASAIG